MKRYRLIILSVLIAIGISYFVNSQSNAGVFTLVVPVQLQNLPPEKVILLPALSQAQVTVRGPSYLLSGIAASPPSFKVRVAKDVGNRFKISLQKSSLALPPKVEVLNIDPTEVEYILDDITTKTVPVVVPRIGQINNTHKLKNIVIKPNKVLVEGPKTELDSLQTIETGPVDLRSIESNQEMRLALRFPGKYTTSKVSEVDVEILTVSIASEKKFTALPIEIRTSTGGAYIADPATADVEVSGPKEFVKILTKDKVIPYVKIKKGKRQGGSIKVFVDVPKEISVVFVDPSKIQVTLEKSPEKKITVSKKK